MGGDATIAGGAGALVRAAGALLAVVLCVGCATSGTQAGAARNGEAQAPAAGGAAWDLPAGAVPSQRLYQGSYEGPEGGGAFRATLRLAAPERFRLDAADRLGRPLWTIGVDGGAAWWIDHHAGFWCADLSRLALPGFGRGPMPATALPALLLGVLPMRPAQAVPHRQDANDTVEVIDDAGRRWQATVEGGRVNAWSVAEGEQPLWWWRRQGKGGILSQRNGRQLRWQEVVVEPLHGELPPRTVPADYRESCDELPPS